MIIELLSRLFPQRKISSFGHGINIPKSEHHIDDGKISESAKNIVFMLQGEGYQALIVGGAVRDLLFGLKPKDFDVATSATPEQVKAIFRRSRIIGRRFRLVHVYWRKDMLEISTFRRAVPQNILSRVNTDKEGRILRDNAFGTQAEDAKRRDFTLNALFYDPAKEVVIDYCEGYPDLKSRILRTIGDPKVRFREDPVRILRAIRFSAKLDLKIDHKSNSLISSMSRLLLNVPSSRLFEETLKTLICGNSVAAILKLSEEGLLDILIPQASSALSTLDDRRFLLCALRQTDERIKSGQSVSPAFVFAAIYWHEINKRWSFEINLGKKRFGALLDAIEFNASIGKTSGIEIPRRFEDDMRAIWLMQARLLNRGGRRPRNLIRAKRFRAGYDFLLLRCQVGQERPEIGIWWTSFQEGLTDDERAESVRSRGRNSRQFVNHQRKRPLKDRKKKSNGEV